MILEDSGYVCFIPVGAEERPSVKPSGGLDKQDSHPSFHQAGINELKVCNATSLYACDIVNKISKVYILTNELLKLYFWF